MRIAIFTNNYLPNPYGVSMSIESFRQEFEKLGHTVYVFAPRAKGYSEVGQNVFRYPALNFSFKGIRFPIAIPYSYRISRILKDLEIDVIHSQHPNLLGWAAMRWAKKKKVPLVFTWHTLYDQYAHFAPLVPEKIAAWWAIRSACAYAAKCSKVIAPTPSVKAIIEKWGVKKSSIAVIATGVDQALYEKADGKEVRAKYGVAEDEILILLVSRLTAEKNVHFIFDSLSALLQENPKLKFLVAGAGQERAELEKKVRQRNLQAKIFFAGVVSAKVIKNYYAAADLFVYASKSETQGMILTEAMYMGLPIVAVRAPGAQDLVGNFVTGILTKENEKDFAAATSRLTSDQKLRAEFSLRAKEIARENYTASICAKKMLNIYEKAAPLQA